mgnify:CR=1 FL=1|tara:strand:- start:10495 stop:10959 length:465 start_codon:yes stop_codon:yes gene_type:complete
MSNKPYTIIEPKIYEEEKQNSNVTEKVEIDDSLENVIENSEILPQDHPSDESLYANSIETEYNPADLEQLWDYDSSVEGEEVSNEYKSPEIMDAEEVDEAVNNVQFSQVAGDTGSISYRDRERLANTAKYDPVGVRIRHSLNRITDDVDFNRIY